jgi:DNA-3-methyladenine glycosylase I
MRTYHDLEWGVPLRDPHRLFELLCLEGAQAGLAWITILRRRAAYRAAFADFSVQRMARFDDADRERLLADAGIVRNRSKVDAFIGNARAWLAVEAPVALIWSFVDGGTIQNRWVAAADVPAVTERSQALSNELRARGFRFIGPTIAYALMQSAGLVNDHLLGCFRHAELAAEENG